MRYLSVCSGIEAASCAWRPLGWEPIAFSEIEKYPSAMLAHHYLGVPNHGDLRRYKEWPDVGAVDVLVGGTPCQSFSVAGLRKGMDDPRGKLVLTFLGLVDRTRPRWVVWENVPGVLSSNGGRDFGSLLGALGELGYGWAYRVLDAQYWGLAQRRKRVFVAGYLGSWTRAAAVLFERAGLRGDPPPSREAGEEAAGTLTARTGGGSGPEGPDSAAVGHLIAGQCQGSNVGEPGTLKGDGVTSGIPFVAMSLTAKGDSGRMDAESETLITHPLKGEGFDASEDGTGRGTPLVAGALQAGGKTAGSATTQDAMSGLLVPYRKVHRAHDADDGETWDRADVANTLNPHDVGERDTHAIAFHNRQDPNVSGDVTPPLGAADKGLGVLYDGVRRLTPLECERLQGFPDGYTLIEYRGKPAKDGPRYRALGNSMGVPVMRWLGKRIGLVETLCA